MRLEEWKGGHHYYIVFDKRYVHKCRWWHYVLDKRFNHCFLLAKASHTQTLMINPLHWGIVHNIYDMTIEQSLEHFTNAGATAILQYKVEVKINNRWHLRGLYSCVTIAKSIINSRRLAITPKQLYKALLKDGALKILGD